MYKQSSLQPIINLLKSWEVLSPTDIAWYFGKSKAIIHKYLKELEIQEQVEKVWIWTHVKYRLRNIKDHDIKKILSYNDLEKNIPYQNIDVLEKEFLKFAPNGEIWKGYTWFVRRCDERKLDVQSKSQQFVNIYKHIISIQNTCGMLDVTKIFSENISPSYINLLCYADQYKWMEFGRWKLAEMTFYAKQSQNLGLIKESIDLIRHKLTCLIKERSPDAIAMTPHSIHRTNQLLLVLGRRLNDLKIPQVKLIKYFPNRIPIPQKSLKTREQRIQNAKETILINDPGSISKYKTILLIDDFVWSGATLNETAYKLKKAWAKKIIGFAFVWNANLSYDVINEV